MSEQRTRFRRCGSACLWLLVLLPWLATAQNRPSILPVGPQSTTPAFPSNRVSLTAAELSPKVQARLTEVRGELGRWLSARADSTNLPAGATPGEAVAYQAALDSTIRSEQQHLGELARLEAARQDQIELEANLRSGTGFSEPPPYSVLRVDALRNSIQSLKTKIEAGQTTRGILESFIAEGETALKQSDERMRRLTEELEAPQDKTRLPALNWQRTLEQARHDLAAAQASLNSTRQLRLQTELAEQQQRLAFLQRQLASCEGHITFSAADFASVTQGLDREVQGPRCREDRSGTGERAAAGGTGCYPRRIEPGASAIQRARRKSNEWHGGSGVAATAG